MALSNNMNALLDGTLNVGKKDVNRGDEDDPDKNEHQDEKVGKLKGAGDKSGNANS